MNGFILSLICICWLLSYGPSLCWAACKVVPNSLSYSSSSSKLTELSKGVATQTVWCSGGAILMQYKDFSPFVMADFQNSPTIVGVGLKGAPATQPQNGFPSFQIYSMVASDKYEAVREGNLNNRQIKIFPGITPADNVKDKLKDYMFDYPVTTKKLKIVFKLKLGRDKVCIRIQFYQKPEICGDQPNNVDKCKSNKGGCENTCNTLPGSFYCSCSQGKILWRNGLNCVPKTADEFQVVNKRLTYEESQAECRRLGGFLSTLFSATEQSSLVAKITQPANQKYFLGVVDVDHDQSYSRWIDGSDVVYEAFQQKRTSPGSTGLFVNSGWTFNQERKQMYSCRITKQDSYLLSGYHGIQDFQLTSSPYLLLYSAISAIAFGPASSRRGSKAYIKTHTGLEYGSMWRPKPQEKNKFLKLTLNSENEITGVTVFGDTCSSPSIKFHIKYKTFDESSSRDTKQYSIPPESEELVFISPHITATEIELRLTDNSVCVGFRWDLTGRLTGRRLADECRNQNPCSHYCIDTPESFYCRCPKGYHLFIDEKTCLPDLKPIIDGPELLALDYPEFTDVIQSSSKSPTYYQFYPNEKTMSEAKKVCRKFGGFLPAIHKVSEQRLLLSKLSGYSSCTKWLLGINGTRLVHTQWMDGSWVDFALFDGSVPEKYLDKEVKVAYMDKAVSYLWKYGLTQTVKGCFVCQYKQRDCDMPIIGGVWPLKPGTISRGKRSPLSMISVLRDLKNHLRFFESNYGKDFMKIFLGYTFRIHSFKCSSLHGHIVSGLNTKQQETGKTYEYKFNFVYSLATRVSSKTYLENGVIKDFDCGPTPYVYKTHQLKPSVVGQMIIIKWEYKTHVAFSFSFQLYGCPAYPEVKKVKVNYQCGSPQPSMYSMTSLHSFVCMYKQCKLSVETCSPFNNYYLPSPGHVCSANDACASMPCDDGTICLDYGTRHECHCPQKYDEGNCGE
ncbi:uncharacterized protein LOC121384267 [Gigantopelta aegis]|uniref:uncharacterized protein LOC121384267 n=1 Tax=Gigantopelta aegis TaxID=1735272 RepID=UPI001B88D0C3|nr:uncharacterized protein LOC121384267 [Gigantopelta aegis]